MGITQETINHRKLVQELYDRRTLHKIVGARPLPVVVKSSDEISFRKPAERESSSSKSKASRAVESVWDTEDASHDFDHEEYYSRRHRHRPAADEERGRYDIGQQPSKKRRKTGRESDAHTVVFVDDDDDEEERRADEMEDGEYMSLDSESDDDRRPKLSRRSSAKSDHRRSYWLSKGIGPPDDQSN
ncbi:hypothetical protein M413DRAFT_82359 [Hebeloma cylindrosporum]|uniref:Uncharacterized protein n=1 Tax=Hebeloma cylindrosporum TaxID=76867 RepID=A0A0C2Z634_HEBCY|nr:hypothetical protein M413DRAFT_82359 [Hebeloma cylindrosporum h7]